ncbi:MAG: Hpt domain-containing protein [Bacteroidetes bacterium]|nr:Hpt domain-containing protein [Bacteroidota bacterium]
MDYRLINSDYLDSVAGDDPQIITEIVTMFKDQVVEIFAEMKLLYSRKEYNTLGMLAHKAKSSVAIMGMAELATMLKTFELSAKEGKDSELYESYINRFGDDTKIAISELEDLVSNRLKKS